MSALSGPLSVLEMLEVTPAGEAKMPSVPQLQTFFDQIDVNKSGTVTPNEVELVLSNNPNLNPKTVSMMCRKFDNDKNKQISFTEFIAMCACMVDWQNLFRKYDADKSGSIDRIELGNFLKSCKYELSPPICQQLLRKIVGTETDAVKFDDFLQFYHHLQDVSSKFETSGTDEAREHNENILRTNGLI